MLDLILWFGGIIGAFVLGIGIGGARQIEIHQRMCEGRAAVKDAVLRALAAERHNYRVDAVKNGMHEDADVIWLLEQKDELIERVKKEL
jgi:hypothetical protein